MLPKLNRLLRTDYSLVFKKGRRIRGRNFSLTILPAEDKKEPTKIGIIVTKKVFKKAVDRNKLKRQIRSTLINGVLDTLPSGQKIVLTAFTVSKTSEFKDISDEIKKLFSHIA